MAAAVAATVPSGREADAYGRCLGAGIARNFSMDDVLDETQQMELMPIPESFICPISNDVMDDPVATVDGNIYERTYIIRWFRERRQRGLPITSPATGLDLASTFVLPVIALKRAIETYIQHRPELKHTQTTKRSYEEAAAILQNELLEKQAVHASVADELNRLRLRNSQLEAENEQLQFQLVSLQASYSVGHDQVSQQPYQPEQDLQQDSQRDDLEQQASSSYSGAAASSTTERSQQSNSAGQHTRAAASDEAQAALEESHEEPDGLCVKRSQSLQSLANALPSNIPLGMRVYISGLSSSAGRSLNGKLGVVKAICGERVAVEVNESNIIPKILPVNLYSVAVILTKQIVSNIGLEPIDASALISTCNIAVADAEEWSFAIRITRIKEESNTIWLGVCLDALPEISEARTWNDVNKLAVTSTGHVAVNANTFGSVQLKPNWGSIGTIGNNDHLIVPFFTGDVIKVAVDKGPVRSSKLRISVNGVSYCEVPVSIAFCTCRSCSQGVTKLNCVQAVTNCSNPYLDMPSLRRFHAMVGIGCDMDVDLLPGDLQKLVV